MFKFRAAGQRGHFENDWLNSWHSFSFSSYFDAQHMDFNHLRVINDDKVASKKGFGFHPHRDMEIITFMLEGEIEHRDNLGNQHILKSGNAQLMRAGSGIVHSEINQSNMACQLLQIWIKPNELGLNPGWWEKSFTTSGNIVIAEPLIKTHQLKNLIDIQSNGLGMAQNGYILVIKNNTELDFLKFGNSDVYFHQIKGQSAIHSNINQYAMTEGDALMSHSIAHKVSIQPENNSSTLVFIFPN